MPPALSRDPEVINDKLNLMKKRLAERDVAVRQLTEEIAALTAGMQEVIGMLRDTSTGLAPTDRIARATAWIMLLIGRHGLPQPSPAKKRR